MRNDALFERHEAFIAAAVIAAHAHAQGDGFRQRDAKFLVELFSNWVEHSLKFRSLVLKNTQISRYLDDLAGEGFARRINRGKVPIYKLTRAGLIELTNRIVKVEYFERPERFLFSLYFVRNYKERILDIIKAEGTKFPPSLEIEIKALFNERQFLDYQIQLTEREVEKLNARIFSAIDSSKIAISMYSRGSNDEEVATAIDKRHPYELSSQKPLAELFRNIMPTLRRWELEVGTIKRAEEIWIPARNMLLNYLKVLRGLRL